MRRKRGIKNKKRLKNKPKRKSKSKGGENYRYLINLTIYQGLTNN